MSRVPARRAGFTLMELLVSVAIIAILATMAVPTAQLQAQRTREQELRTELRRIREALDAYKRAVDDGRIAAPANASGYPRSLEVLAEGVENAKDPRKGKLFFLRRLPRDPMVTDARLPAAQTWGTRSYASTAEDAQAGEDVFDVHSLATGTGLNGVAYRDW